MNFFSPGLPRARSVASLQRLLCALPQPAPRPAPQPGPDERSAAGLGTFTGRTFANAAGSRDYKLFCPAKPAAPAGLIVMLHGCTQSADDFAAGTQMNEAAGAAGWYVAYPQQPSGANAQKCWNWFRPADQRRGAGEPAILAGLACAMAREHAVDPSRIYVAGLSAGGAAAALLARAYPDVFAAAGIHSGLACGAAHDIPSALAAMRAGSPDRMPGSRTPVIVFQGDRDTTVNPSNARHILDAAVPAAWLGRREAGQVPGGHFFTRDIHTAADGRPIAERWTVHGAAHAWSGGSARGTYTDPRGPDATAEMLRFFRATPGDGTS